MATRGFRQSLSLPGLLKNTRQLFEQIPDDKSGCTIPLADHLMSGMAIFGLKYPSLLQFDQDRFGDTTGPNLKNLYGISQAPSDTYLRERLDQVNPDYKEVFPLAPEPIVQQDGTRKNDCERNAAKRLLKDTRREHPHMKFIVIEDGLSSNAPHIRRLQELNYRYLLGAKQSDHKFLFNWVDQTTSATTHEITDKKGITHRFRYLNKVPLNDANFELEVNFLEYWEIKPNGKTTHFAWVTDIPIEQKNLMKLMRAARARWKVENETFNTLKNHSYHFEHNFGHGYHHLCSVMVHLMMLAFLIDQIQQRCCRLFNRALEKSKSKTRFWRKIRELFRCFLIPHWEALYLGIANELKPTAIPYNTS